MLRIALDDEPNTAMLLYFSARVVRVTVMCEYARIKLYDFTIVESEEKREQC